MIPMSTFAASLPRTQNVWPLGGWELPNTSHMGSREIHHMLLFAVQGGAFGAYYLQLHTPLWTTNSR